MMEFFIGLIIVIGFAVFAIIIGYLFEITKGAIAIIFLIIAIWALGWGVIHL